MLLTSSAQYIPQSPTLLRGSVDLSAQLDDVRDAKRPVPNFADDGLPRRSEEEAIVGEVALRDKPPEVTGLWEPDAERT